MTAAHAPEFIQNQTDKTVRSILYVCWVATFNTPEHHMGLGLAQSQVRCILFACHDGRNANSREFIDSRVAGLVNSLRHYKVWSDCGDLQDKDRLTPIRRAERLARLRDMAVTP